MHEALWAYGGLNLFCAPIGVTKQIFTCIFGRFCLILPHMPHVLRIVNIGIFKNMRLMREYEEGVFKGFYLSRIEMGEARSQNMRQPMLIHEDHPHIFAKRGA
jgi:hypothetical protein